jgi:hypothetical protein
MRSPGLLPAAPVCSSVACLWPCILPCSDNGTHVPYISDDCPFNRPRDGQRDNRQPSLSTRVPFTATNAAKGTLVGATGHVCAVAGARRTASIFVRPAGYEIIRSSFCDVRRCGLAARTRGDVCRKLPGILPVQSESPARRYAEDVGRRWCSAHRPAGCPEQYISKLRDPRSLFYRAVNTIGIATHTQSRSAPVHRAAGSGLDEQSRDHSATRHNGRLTRGSALHGRHCRIAVVRSPAGTPNACRHVAPARPPLLSLRPVLQDCPGYSSCVAAAYPAALLRVVSPSSWWLSRSDFVPDRSASFRTFD